MAKWTTPFTTITVSKIYGDLKAELRRGYDLWVNIICYTVSGIKLNTEDDWVYYSLSPYCIHQSWTWWNIPCIIKWTNIYTKMVSRVKRGEDGETHTSNWSLCSYNYNLVKRAGSVIRCLVFNMANLTIQSPVKSLTGSIT